MISYRSLLLSTIILNDMCVCICVYVYVCIYMCVSICVYIYVCIYIYVYIYIYIYVLLKALPPVCMKYTARDESRVANIARGEAKCYI